MLQFAALRRHCEVVLAETLQPETVKEMRALAKAANATELERRCVAFALRNLPSTVDALVGATLPPLAPEHPLHEIWPVRE